MTRFDLVDLRLSNQGLVKSAFTTPAEVVSHLGAVQAQDYAAAKWALGLRIPGATDAVIEDAFNDGSILRTHVMRPTWHFVMPEDIRWMLELTSPQVKKLMGHYNRKLELTDALFANTNKAIKKALSNNTYLTRQELKKVFEGMGITTDVQRLAHIIMWAELDGLICSGPRKGKQFTYALLEDRVEHKTAPFNRDESLAKLALTYFTSHGPAQIKDFSWWSGLSMKDSAVGLDLIKSKLTHESIEGKEYWFSPNARRKDAAHGASYLLSIFDEYVIAYKDRSALDCGERHVEKMISMGNALTAVIILDGQIVGTWKRTLKKTSVEIKLSTFRDFNKQEQEAIEKAGKDYGKFLGIPATLTS